MPPVIKEKKNAVASDTLKPDASVNSSSLPLTHISGTLHMIQSLDETDPPEFEAKKGNERDKELHMKVSTGEVSHDPHAVELCENYFEDLKKVHKKHMLLLSKLAEGQYGGDQPGADVYELKKLPMSSSSSSLSGARAPRLQLTKMSQTCPQLAAATTQAQQDISNEIEKRRADIQSIREQILEISEQIADEGDEDRVLGTQMSDLSQMQGQHKKRIRELEALKETTVTVEVERKCVRLVLEREETSSVKTETKVVPAKERKKPCLYVLGGYGGEDSEYLSSVERYTSGTKRWELLEDAPMSSKRLFAAAVLDKQLFVMGGYDGKTHLSTVEVFDPELERWEVLPARLQTGRLGCAAAVLEGCMYVLGGEDNDRQAFSSVERYNAERKRWELLAPMRQRRFGPAAAVLGGRLYAMGGFDEGGNDLKTVERYDAERNVWEAVADLNTARYGCAAAVLDGKLYVLGGWTDDDETLSSVECYDVERNEWELVGAMNHGRGFAAAAVLEGELYVMGGQGGVGGELYVMGVGYENDNDLDSLEKYDAERDVWVELEDEGATLRVCRNGHAAAVV